MEFILMEASQSPTSGMGTFRHLSMTTFSHRNREISVLDFPGNVGKQ